MAQPHVSVSPDDIIITLVLSSVVLIVTLLHVDPADWTSTAAPEGQLSFDATNTLSLVVVLVNQDNDLEDSESLMASIQLVMPVARVTLQPDVARITITDSSREC